MKKYNKIVEAFKILKDNKLSTIYLYIQRNIHIRADHMWCRHVEDQPQIEIDWKGNPSKGAEAQ